MKLFIYIICLGVYIEQSNYAYAAELPEREEDSALADVLELEEPSIPTLTKKEQQQLLEPMEEKIPFSSLELPPFKKGLKLPSFLIKTAEVKKKKPPARRNFESLKKNKVFRSQELSDVLVTTVKNPVYKLSQAQEGLEEWEKSSKSAG
ncbi:MAG: hypothetical protein K0M45_07270 [Candidatus Paracaedibacteraceae bacterium]|nr:hypothetical protein [Candidatus Paracaedibacteraceae bacterium]